MSDTMSSGASRETSSRAASRARAILSRLQAVEADLDHRAVGFVGRQDGAVEVHGDTDGLGGLLGGKQSRAGKRDREEKMREERFHGCRLTPPLKHEPPFRLSPGGQGIVRELSGALMEAGRKN